MTNAQMMRFEDLETIENPNEYKQALEEIESIEEEIREEEGHELSVIDHIYGE